MMRRLTTFCLVALLALAAGNARAQDDDPPVTTYDFDPVRIDVNSCWFVDGRVRDIMETDDDYRAIARYLREAEPHVRRYVEDSLGRQQDAVAMAFRDFAAWHRHRVAEDNAETLARQQLANIIGTGLQHAMTVMLPGSGAVASAIRGAGTTVYEQVVANAGGGTTDPQAYLDAVSGQLEDSEALRATFADAMFNTVDNAALRDRVEAIKFEYAMERRAAERQASQVMTELRPDTCSGQMLADLGIPRPSEGNFHRTRREVLERLMFEKLCIEMQGNNVGNCETTPHQIRAAAEGGARRLIRVGRANVAQMWNLTDPEDLAAICPDDYYPFGAFSGPHRDCREWKASRR